jgi:hypothetical protein
MRIEYPHCEGKLFPSIIASHIVGDRTARTNTHTHTLILHSKDATDYSTRLDSTHSLTHSVTNIGPNKSRMTAPLADSVLDVIRMVDLKPGGADGTLTVSLTVVLTRFPSPSPPSTSRSPSTPFAVSHKLSAWNRPDPVLFKALKRPLLMTLPPSVSSSCG